jgi:hypothetical protein
MGGVGGGGESPLLPRESANKPACSRRGTNGDAEAGCSGAREQGEARPGQASSAQGRAHDGGRANDAGQGSERLPGTEKQLASKLERAFFGNPLPVPKRKDSARSQTCHTCIV